jgi:hypothetical protein|tara:strand:+ start:533 stop:916 length:384 start_codon:yes stop_codon:yes gene_type:complete
MSNVARAEVPMRMRSITVRMKIDDRRVLAIVDYSMSATGISPMAVWIKVRPTESTLDRELRASGKMTSLLLQYGCSFKEIAETLTKDSIVGAAITYLHKNLESILAGEQGDKVPNLNTDPYKIKDVG